MNNNNKAIEMLEELSQSLSERLDLVSGSIIIYMGAGNREYLYEIVYKKDMYGPGGSVGNSPPAIVKHGPTFYETVKALYDEVFGTQIDEIY